MIKKIAQRYELLRKIMRFTPQDFSQFCWKQKAQFGGWVEFTFLFTAVISNSHKIMGRRITNGTKYFNIPVWILFYWDHHGKEVWPRETIKDSLVWRVSHIIAPVYRLGKHCSINLGYLSILYDFMYLKLMLTNWTNPYPCNWLSNAI